MKKEAKVDYSKVPFKELPQKEQVKKVLGITANVVQILIVIVALILSVIVIVYTYNRDATELPSLFGVSFLTVHPLADSMNPDGEFYTDNIATYATEFPTVDTTALQGFKPGDMTIVHEFKYGRDDIKVGDVITFWDPSIGDGWFNTHRVVQIDIEGGIKQITTKGDNTPVGKVEHLTEAQVKAVWKGSKIAGFGDAIDWVKQETNFLLVIVLPLALLFFLNIFFFVRELVKANVDKSTKKMQASKEAEVEAAKQAAIAEFLAKMEMEKAMSNGAPEGEPKITEEVASKQPSVTEVPAEPVAEAVVEEKPKAKAPAKKKAAPAEKKSTETSSKASPKTTKKKPVDSETASPVVEEK